MTWAWRTLASGLVEVDQGQGFRAISLAGPNESTARVLELVPSVLGPASVKYSIPLPWLCGIAYAESGGNPGAIAKDGGRGLMQIHPTNLVSLGLTPESALDARESVRAACELIVRLEKTAGPLDLPRCASMYNAGGTCQGGRCAPHESPSSPWGIRETKGHIERVVRPSNWFNRHFATHGVPRGPAMAQASSGGLGGVLALAVCAGFAWWWLR